MTIYYNDERDYTPVIESWIRRFISTMDEDRDLYPGNDSGDAPFGVKIIFDGFGDKLWIDDNGDCQYASGGDMKWKSFTVFVHKNSLTDEFVPHEMRYFALLHRPKEEVCIYAWYNEETDTVDVIPFEDNYSTELDTQFVVDLIFSIHQRDNPS